MEIDMELKSFIVLYGGKFIRVYKENEADKVIAEKDEEIAELKEQVHDYAQGLYVMLARAEKEARHHKFKRCKDTAKICYLRFVRYEQYLDSLTSTPETMARWRFLKGHYERWEKRWQDLADKFKGDV